MKIKLRFRENGPYVLDLPEGTKFRMDGEERTLQRAKLALCRCGHSGEKPLCDGTHKKVGFVAPAGELEMEL